MTGLPLAEAFGPTLQGEGPAAGQNAAFLRLGGCNLSCSWCDTPYTWDGSRFDLREQITPTEVPDILAKLPVARIVVITGGEPLLNQRNPEWPELLSALHDRYADVHVETNGTIAPTPDTLAYVGLFTVSPKLPHAGKHRGKQDPAPAAIWPDVPNAIVKYVVRDAFDVDDATRIAKQAGWPPHRTWVMPEGTSTRVLQERWPAIAAAAAEAGINATHRLHVLAWNDERGH